MKCLKCKVKLNRIEYEGLNIRQCEVCRGQLLTMSRLKAIQSRRHKSEAELLEEIVNEGDDSLGKIKCPECIRTMEKRKKRIGTLEFFIDLCRKCDFIWLDEGELAKMQVLYEFSEKGEEAERFRQRLNNMTAEEKAALNKRIANLPEENISHEIAASLITRYYFGHHGMWHF